MTDLRGRTPLTLCFLIACFMSAILCSFQRLPAPPGTRSAGRAENLPIQRLDKLRAPPSGRLAALRRESISALLGWQPVSAIADTAARRSCPPPPASAGASGRLGAIPGRGRQAARARQGRPVAVNHPRQRGPHQTECRPSRCRRTSTRRPAQLRRPRCLSIARLNNARSLMHLSC